MKCRSCESVDLRDILSLGDQYLSDFRDDDVKPPRYPLDLVLCQKCSLLQLRHTTPPEEMYNERYGYKSGINGTIRKNLVEIANEVLMVGDLRKDDIIVDIGCNDGTLLENYPSDYQTIGFEPISKFVEEARGRAKLVINDFFNAEVYLSQVGDRKAKVVTAVSMFYDLDDPNKFIKDVATILDQEGVFIVQQNYLVGMLEQNAVDNIVHEHLEYYSLFSMEPLLRRHGLAVFDVSQNDINGGSFRTLIGKTGVWAENPRVQKMRETEALLNLNTPKPYLDFAQRVEGCADLLYATVRNFVDAGKTVYVLGASTRGNTILQYANLTSSLITAASERNPEKYGKKIASLGIPIVTEEQARLAKPDYMLILPWFFSKEIVSREVEYLKQGGHLIVPLPQVKVIDKDNYER